MTLPDAAPAAWCAAGAAAGVAAPVRWLGAPAPGGLALPDAHPTASTLYGPRGVWLGDELVVGADSGNHRVLLWRGVPTDDHQPADVILGQPSATSEGPAAAGRGPERGFHLPTGVAVVDGNLVVADAWHHRVLVWDGVPVASDAAPSYAIGQPSLSAVAENRGGEPTASSCYWPFGIGLVAGWFWVADTGNRRVLGWQGGLPDGDRPADVVLGQDTPSGRGENRDGSPAADSFRWPHGVTGTDEVLYVADAGNHRVLGWWGIPDRDRPADCVLGQPSFSDAREWPYGPQGPSALRFPYGVAVDGGRLHVADTSNNRVLRWPGLPAAGTRAEPAELVLAQPDFGASGENRWSHVGADTLCWPFGLSVRGASVAVADSGNNRIMIWQVPE